MEMIKNSPLLDRIYDKARALCEENRCRGLTRDYIVIAAVMVLNEDETDALGDEEHRNTRRLLDREPLDERGLNLLLEKWKGISIPLSEAMMLTTQMGKAVRTAQEMKRTRLTADLLLEEILREGTPAIRSLKGKTGGEQPSRIGDLMKVRADDPEEDTIPAGKDREEPREEKAPEEPASMADFIRRTKDLQNRLQKTVFGQQYAVNTFASGYFQSELEAAIEKERRRPRATFLFAGPPGVGKTFLSEEAARILDLPFRRFDMSEYTGPNATDELSGSDANYRGSAEGQLTGFVSKHPRCVLLFDEIEKASLEVIHLFLQVLDAGRLRDNRTDREVEFRDTILIFTTNAGKQLYEEASGENLSAMSRDVILNALSQDKNPKNNEPFFPAAICSRFASGNVVMFNRLDAFSLRGIVQRELDRHTRDLKERMGISVTMDDTIASALLYAEGAAADARTVKSRAGSFFSGELYELFRLISREGSEKAAESVKSVHFALRGEKDSAEISRLFIPAEKIHVLLYSAAAPVLDDPDVRLPVMHTVRTAEEADRVLSEENIQLVLCDLLTEEKAGNAAAFLNREDRPSAGREFLLHMLSRYPGIPVVLTETAARGFSDEEKISYLARGVQDFLRLDPDGLKERIRSLTDRVFQQNGMIRLARANQLLRFETAQRLNPAGDGAEILLFDLKLEKSVRADDQGTVLSMLSTPDVKFEDIIGAEDAKKELAFFIGYMKNPKRYRKQGVSSPKGVLLYGPPGTGKTMLAKAFAAESGATFIAAEGNQFAGAFVGDGSRMMKRIFATARRYAPSVVFIDEIDTIGRARTGRNTDMAQDSEQTLTALFTQLDGFTTDEDKPVFVLGATNYTVEQGTAMSLDAALLRRFDRRILIDLPTLENRRLFLEKETGKKALFHVTENGLQSLADRSTGMSLAQLASILDLAVRTAVQNQAGSVDDKGLDEAFETFTGGEAKRWSEEITLRTARHEAGHTLISWLAGEKPSYVTIVSRGHFGGYMQYADQEDRFGFTKRELLDRIRIALGGRASEIVYYGETEGISTGASSDLKKATDLAVQMLCAYGMDDEFGPAVADPAGPAVALKVRDEANDILKTELARAVKEITEHRAGLDRLVEGLLQKNSLRESEIDGILTAGA